MNWKSLFPATPSTAMDVTSSGIYKCPQSYIYFRKKYSVKYSYLRRKRRGKTQQQQQLQRYPMFLYSEVVLILWASLSPACHVRFEDVRSQEVIISFVGLGTCSEEMFILSHGWIGASIQLRLILWNSLHSMLAPVLKEYNVFMLGSWCSIYKYPILYGHGLLTKNGLARWVGKIIHYRGESSSFVIMFITMISLFWAS